MIISELEVNCGLCQESKLGVGKRTQYGSVIVYKIGIQNGWFATLSPKSWGSPKNITVQIMPMTHIKHISELGESDELAKNYGLVFSHVSKALTQIMKEENRNLENEENVIRVCVYGKSKHPNEHLHIKLFPWEYPYVVDSTYENKKVLVDEKGNEFVKMKPVKKAFIDGKRFNHLAERLIWLLNQGRE